MVLLLVLAFVLLLVAGVEIWLRVDAEGSVLAVLRAAALFLVSGRFGAPGALRESVDTA